MGVLGVLGVICGRTGRTWAYKGVHGRNIAGAVKRVHFEICVLEVDYVHSLHSINPAIDYFYNNFTLNNMLLASR